MAKDKDYRQMIHTARWAALRRSVLSAHPLCERCLEQERTEAATEVHHICPVEDAVAYADKRQRMFDSSNLRALCHNCHVEAHKALGRAGKAAAIRRNREQTRQVIERFFGKRAET